jgi:hypothetical protein
VFGRRGLVSLDQVARRAKAEAQKAQANNLKGPKKKFDRPPKPEKVSKPLPPRRSLFKEIE